MGLLDIDNFSIDIPVSKIWDLWCDHPHGTRGGAGPAEQVTIEFLNKEFPIDDFPSAKRLLSMIADELRIQYGCCVDLCYEREFNPRISWRPIRKPYLDVWLKGTYPDIVYIRNYYEHPELK